LAYNGLNLKKKRTGRAMFSFVSGLLAEKVQDSPRGAYVVVDSHGIGFEIRTSSRSLSQAPSLGEPIRLYTSLLVREDALTLVGFMSREERDLFAILQTASGVGTKVALSLLSTLSVSEIAQAVVAGEYKLLTRAKGVGAKLAQKMALDLKEKMTQWRSSELGLSLVYGDEQSVSIRQGGNAEAFHEAESVLLSLGYQPEEISRSFVALGSAEGVNTLSAELILRDTLRWLAQSV
jgi:Holliday junction DNA helicase RuvA